MTNTSRCPMPLDPPLEDDDSQPWWQMSPPLRITVHPAAPASPPPDSRARADGVGDWIEPDGFPNDWIEPDGYPDDWISPAGARTASGGIDRIAPAKAAAGVSFPNDQIEPDGFPNDWIEPDGYPDDWISSAGARTASGGIDRIAPAKAAAGVSFRNDQIEPDGFPNDWIEPDGYPDDWISPAGARASSDGIDNWTAPATTAANIEPDGYPDDWIMPASTRTASGIDRIAPAKAAAGVSLPSDRIEPDGFPNDWISPAASAPQTPPVRSAAANPGIPDRSTLPLLAVPSPASGRGSANQTPDPETGLTPDQIRNALSFIGRYLRAHDPQLARLPTDVADMFHDAVTDFPEFLRRAEPGLIGLGLGVPMARAAGNVWLLNDLLRGRIAEVVHGRTLPFGFPKIDRFVNGIATSIKSINLNAPYYRDAKALYYTLRNQINRVVDFIGARHASVKIEEHQIMGRALDVLVPHTGSVAQKSAIKQAIEYGAQQGVTVNIIRHQ
jgi:hypothetical protein